MHYHNGMYIGIDRQVRDAPDEQGYTHSVALAGVLVSLLDWDPGHRPGSVPQDGR